MCDGCDKLPNINQEIKYYRHAPINYENVTFQSFEFIFNILYLKKDYKENKVRDGNINILVAFYNGFVTVTATAIKREENLHRFLPPLQRIKKPDFSQKTRFNKII